MLKYNQIALVLKDVTYKPGWTITFHPFPFSDLAWVHIDALVPDSDRPDDETASIRVHINVRAVVPDLTLSDTLTWLLRRLQRIEMHEAREFFRWGGRRWDDPHANSVDLGSLSPFKVAKVDPGEGGARWCVQARSGATSEWDAIVSPFYRTWAQAYEEAWRMVLSAELLKSSKLMRGGWPT